MNINKEHLAKILLAKGANKYSIEETIRFNQWLKYIRMQLIKLKSKKIYKKYGK